MRNGRRYICKITINIEVHSGRLQCDLIFIRIFHNVLVDVGYTRIRAGNSKIGIIMLTARTQEMDKVTGFMTGADDYVTKPFSPAELTARIDALYRRIGGDMMDDGEIQQPPFVLNTRKRTLEKNGQRVKLTQVEYAIMKMFMENPGKALSREEILKSVWGENYLGELKIVDVNIRRLRLKIEDEPTSPIYITTNWGYGYKWDF